MKPRKGYLLHSIAGETYLLPYGQNIADHKRGVLLNKSGILLWNALCQDASRKELLSLLAQHYQAGPEDFPVLRKDIDSFLTVLDNLGILENDRCPEGTDSFFFRIGPLTLAFQGPESLIYPDLFDFSCSPGSADQTITIAAGYPGERMTGEILVRNHEITICANENYYIFLYPRFSRLLECHLTKDGSKAFFYCMPPFDSSLALKLFHAMRFTYLVLAQEHDLYALHSASILYRDKAWLFSGCSGTGKSTHASLWHTLYQTPILDGDLNLIGMEDGSPVIYGFPWCGTSGQYTTHTYPLGGIVMLKQHSANLTVFLSQAEKALMIAQRFISPTWTADMLCRCLDFSEGLAAQIFVCRLFCTREPAAAQTMKEQIDRLLDEGNFHD